MANRVTGVEVKQIIKTTLAADEVTVFITPANLLVTNKLGSSTLDDATLKEIEKWLTAHFVCIREKRASSKSVGGASVSYEGQTAMGLDFSSYGQQVKLLDTTGILSSIGKRVPYLEAIDPS
jgi:hypothetical protein